MTLNKLASLIANKEGKKHQASIGDIREILKIYFELLCSEDSDIAQGMVDLINKQIEKATKKEGK